MVDHLTHNPKKKGSNPVSTSRGALSLVKRKWQIVERHIASGSSTVVEYLTHNPKIEGSNSVGTIT